MAIVFSSFCAIVALSIVAMTTVFVTMPFLRISESIVMGVFVLPFAMRVAMSTKNQESCQVGG